jgi:predicted HAD superfamily Cof-like phosphohydrolase
MDMFRMVADFQEEVLEVPARTWAESIPAERLEFMVKTLQEEVDEFNAGVTEYTRTGDKAAMADALMDVMYFALGHCYQAGINPYIWFSAVHNSNMQKRFASTERGATDAAKPEGWISPEDAAATANKVAEGVFAEVKPKAQCHELFQRANAIMAGKAEDYNSNGVQLGDYFECEEDFICFIRAKYLRLKSLVGSDGAANFESQEDSLIDLCNYASFYYDFLNEKESN